MCRGRFWPSSGVSHARAGRDAREAVLSSLDLPPRSARPTGRRLGHDTDAAAEPCRALGPVSACASHMRRSTRRSASRAAALSSEKLLACPRAGRALRIPGSAGQRTTLADVTPSVMISERPAYTRSARQCCVHWLSPVSTAPGCAGSDSATLAARLDGHRRRHPRHRGRRVVLRITALRALGPHPSQRRVELARAVVLLVDAFNSTTRRHSTLS